MSQPVPGRYAAAALTFFVTAGLLFAFGVLHLATVPVVGGVELALGVLWVGAGLYLRTGAARARILGLVLAAATIAAGVAVFVLENRYLVGTIIAILALIRLATTDSGSAGPKA